MSESNLGFLFLGIFGIEMNLLPSLWVRGTVEPGQPLQPVDFFHLCCSVPQQRDTPRVNAPVGDRQPLLIMDILHISNGVE